MNWGVASRSPHKSNPGSQGYYPLTPPGCYRPLSYKGIDNVRRLRMGSVKPWQALCTPRAFTNPRQYLGQKIYLVFIKEFRNLITKIRNYIRIFWILPIILLYILTSCIIRWIYSVSKKKSIIILIAEKMDNFFQVLRLTYFEIYKFMWKMSEQLKVR